MMERAVRHAALVVVQEGEQEQHDKACVAKVFGPWRNEAEHLTAALMVIAWIACCERGRFKAVARHGKGVDAGSGWPGTGNPPALSEF